MMATELRAVATSGTPGKYPAKFYRGAVDERRGLQSWKRVQRCEHQHPSVPEAEHCAAEMKAARSA